MQSQDLQILKMSENFLRETILTGAFEDMHNVGVMLMACLVLNKGAKISPSALDHLKDFLMSARARN